MRLDREGRRTVAQFLNGFAVAILATGVLTPLAGGGTNWLVATTALLAAGALHAAAIAVSSA